MRLTNSQKAEKYKEQNQRYKPGYQERQEHIELINNGAKCYLIMCEAINKDAVNRKIKDFDKDRLFSAAKVVQRNDDWWAELLQPVPVDQVKLQ